MPEVKLPEAGITFESVIYVIALAVAVSGVLVALVKGWEAYKKISVRDRQGIVLKHLTVLLYLAIDSYVVKRKDLDPLDILRKECLKLAYLLFVS